MCDSPRPGAAAATSEGQPGAWYVYLLGCADGTLYTGITTDLARRVATHAAGRGARYTRSRLPVTPLYAARCADRSEASRREAAIKRMRRDEKLALVRESPHRAFSSDPADWPEAVRFRLRLRLRLPVPGAARGGSPQRGRDDAS